MSSRLTPTELARVVGLDRGTVITLCVEHGIPIQGGQIDVNVFLASTGGERANSWALMDSTGNLIDSFDDPAEAAQAARAIIDADPTNANEIAVIAYDAQGEPIASPRARSASHT